MGYKTFAVGDVLTASDVMTYLMNQANIVCTSGTRPPSPAEGWTIYETDTNLIRTHDGASWVITGGNRYRVTKPSDESITSTTFQDDDHLALAVAANASYEMKLRLFCFADAVGDMKVGWTWPTGTAMDWTVVNALTGTTDGKLFQSDTAAFATNAPTWQTVTIEGVVTTTTTAGTLRLRWAQNGAAAGGATVQAGSVLRLERVS